MDIILIAIIAIQIFFTIVYSRGAVDPDWAMFNLYAFTGSVYGRDFADCKSPAIHIWYAILGKIKTEVWFVKGLHTFLIGIPAYILYALGYPAAGLAFVLLINTGWLFTFHGNVGQIPAGLIAIALVTGNEWIGVVLLLFAVAFETKLAPSALLIALLNMWWTPLIVFGGWIAFGIVLVRWLFPDVWGWLVEANITIPRRMTQNRYKMWRKIGLYPWHEAQAYLYILPWVIVGLVGYPDFRFWLPALVYMILVKIGLAVRQNHLIPLVAWIAIAIANGSSPVQAVLILLIIDFIASGFYLGDYWERFYRAIADYNKDARGMGEWLRQFDKETVWINDMHTGVYIYARKPIMYGLAEQIEIREVAHERRDKMMDEINKNIPRIIVIGQRTYVDYKPINYRQVAQAKYFVAMRRTIGGF